MIEIVARDAERLAGETFVRTAEQGATLLLFEGEAGIGKSTVWSDVVQRAEIAGLTILQSRPAAAESKLTLSGLGDLLETVGDAVLDRLPPAQRGAIDVVLFRSPPSPAVLEQRLLGAAVRSILLELTSANGVVLAIDDVQWFDAASASVLGYALRRVRDRPLGVLAARRLGLTAALDLDTIGPPEARRVVRVGPLSLAALHALLKQRLGAAPPRSALVRIHEASGGNPLFALEIARRLAELGDLAPERPLPVPATVQELVRERVRRLPAPTRETLLLAAAAGRPSATTVSRALGRDVAGDVAIAAEEDIARLADGLIAFDHPLFPGAIYADSSDVARRAAHSRLATAVDDLEQRARHRALGTVGADASVASELANAAQAAAARGAPTAAAGLIGLALDVTPADQVETGWARRLALGQYLVRAGDISRAREVLSALAREAGQGRVRARALLALAGLEFEADDKVAASHALDAVVAAAGDLELEAEAHATVAAVMGDLRAARRHAQSAMNLLDRIEGPDPGVGAQVIRAYVASVVDNGGAMPVDLIERGLELERLAPSPKVSERLSASLGVWLKYNDDFAEAREWLEQTLAEAVDEGDEGSLAYALSHFPTLLLALGDWVRAEEMAQRHLAVAIELGQESQQMQALYNISLVFVHQGRVGEARMNLEDLIERANDDPWDLANGLSGLGSLELALDDLGSAVSALQRASDLRDSIGDDFPRRFDADLVEALAGIGERTAAAAATARMVERAAANGRHSWLAHCARAKAIVAASEGNLDAAVTALDEALAEHEQAPIAFERARTLLVLGGVRRRRRERTMAKQAYEAAHHTFEVLGARLWAERARLELGRVGIRRTIGDLTQAERRAAELAASGLTNRAVAAGMFVSPKTVEGYLARAYEKLGVRSRAELGAVMARGVPDDRTRV